MLNNKINELKEDLKDFLERQEISSTDEKIEKFLIGYLDSYLEWDTLKDDMYDSIWEYFE